MGRVRNRRRASPECRRAQVEDRLSREPDLRAGFDEIERGLRQMAAGSGLPGPQRPHPNDW